MRKISPLLRMFRDPVAPDMHYAKPKRPASKRGWVSQALVIVSLMPLLAIAIAEQFAGIDPQLLMRDVAAVLKGHPLQGFLSTLGLLVWSASATIWFCTWLIASRAGRTDVARFAVMSSALTTYMAVDDSFMFHELIAPRYLLLPEELVLATLAAAVLIYIVAFRDQLRLTPLAGVCVPGLLGLSVLLDVAPQSISDTIGRWQNFAEDGMKWLGINGWFAVALFHFRKALLPEVWPDTGMAD